MHVLWLFLPHHSLSLLHRQTTLLTPTPINNISESQKLLSGIVLANQLLLNINRFNFFRQASYLLLISFFLICPPILECQNILPLGWSITPRTSRECSVPRLPKTSPTTTASRTP